MAACPQRRMGAKEIKAAIPGSSSLGPGRYINLPMKTYSSGMAMRLLFAVATSFDPDILILDEWLGAGDEHFVEKATNRMASFVGRSRAVVIASHNRRLVNEVCNKVLILHHGRVAYFGPLDGAPAELPHLALRRAAALSWAARAAACLGDWNEQLGRGLGLVRDPAAATAPGLRAGHSAAEGLIQGVVVSTDRRASTATRRCAPLR